MAQYNPGQKVHSTFYAVDAEVLQVHPTWGGAVVSANGRREYYNGDDMLPIIGGGDE